MDDDGMAVMLHCNYYHGYFVLQAGCVTMWNLALPLLQSNLRHHVRNPLTLAAQALEDIDSLLVLLRCQMHTELAKCEEAEDQLEYAVTHLTKALEMDDSGAARASDDSSTVRMKRASLVKAGEASVT
ncbi:Cilia and flagella associated protein 46 [Desmophyllum pertusum]|uniref:Cilia and flagella associated protein 46 n=1 Tax=Desmophyllum pertusum TaxID=174260 RepID=A0A9X0D6F6_9CNID|nr:Cilia and flagella associated protein 46 [Desmophyllum pertusum]